MKDLNRALKSLFRGLFKMVLTGIDLVEIKRIEKSLKNERFLKEYFGERERQELAKKNFRPESVAACFAAKEAFLKVIKQGFAAQNFAKLNFCIKIRARLIFIFQEKQKKKQKKKVLNFALALLIQKN
ncbi:MAG: 4'-phosphopantetheinyl transferase superfamily protein [Clostridia bacterium]|nr:4'-phosphopantetheinyl transferase superfamily protein [Clostridia bacterium]